MVQFSHSKVYSSSYVNNNGKESHYEKGAQSVNDNGRKNTRGFEAKNGDLRELTPTEASKLIRQSNKMIPLKDAMREMDDMIGRFQNNWRNTMMIPRMNMGLNTDLNMNTDKKKENNRTKKRKRKRMKRNSKKKKKSVSIKEKNNLIQDFDKRDPVIDIEPVNEMNLKPKSSKKRTRKRRRRV